MDWLINLTQPQATLGAAALTFAGAIIAVLLGWLLFKQKVKGMQSAVTAMEEMVSSHSASVTQTLIDIETKLSGLVESTGKLSADIGDRQAEDEVPAASELMPYVGPSVEEERPEHFLQLADAWHQIRDILERRAADPRIDGRTAAKYQRRDRRSYADLINTMAADGRLPEHELFLEAARIWSRYRSRRMAPNKMDTERLVKIANDLGHSVFG